MNEDGLDLHIDGLGVGEDAVGNQKHVGEEEQGHYAEDLPHIESQIVRNLPIAKSHFCFGIYNPN